MGLVDPADIPFPPTSPIAQQRLKDAEHQAEEDTRQSFLVEGIDELLVEARRTNELLEALIEALGS